MMSNFLSSSRCPSLLIRLIGPVTESPNSEFSLNLTKLKHNHQLADLMIKTPSDLFDLIMAALNGPRLKNLEIERAIASVHEFTADCLYLLEDAIIFVPQSPICILFGDIRLVRFFSGSPPISSTSFYPFRILTKAKVTN